MGVERGIWRGGGRGEEHGVRKELRKGVLSPLVCLRGGLGDREWLRLQWRL